MHWSIGSTEYYDSFNNKSELIWLNLNFRHKFLHLCIQLHHMCETYQCNPISGATVWSEMDHNNVITTTGPPSGGGTGGEGE